MISAGWLTEMVTLAMQEDIGCVGAKLYYPDETIQHGGVIVGLGGVAGHAHKYYNREDCGYMERLIFPQELSAVTAACLLVRKNIFDQVNGLDELNLKVAFNDIDFVFVLSERDIVMFGRLMQNFITMNQYLVELRIILKRWQDSIPKLII